MFSSGRTRQLPFFSWQMKILLLSFWRTRLLNKLILMKSSWQIPLKWKMPGSEKHYGRNTEIPWVAASDKNIYCPRSSCGNSDSSHVCLYMDTPRIICRRCEHFHHIFHGTRHTGFRVAHQFGDTPPFRYRSFPFILLGILRLSFYKQPGRRQTS